MAGSVTIGGRACLTSKGELVTYLRQSMYVHLHYTYREYHSFWKIIQKQHTPVCEDEARCIRIRLVHAAPPPGV